MKISITEACLIVIVVILLIALIAEPGRWSL